jgi:hypothetical protein
MTRKYEDELAQRFHALITPGRTDVLRAKRAVLAKFDDGGSHTSAALLDAVSDVFGTMRDMGRVEVQFLQDPDPDLVDGSTPAVHFLRARVAGMFAIGELATASIIEPALPPPSGEESTHIQWLTDDSIRVGIQHPGGGYSVSVVLPRPALEQAYLRPSNGDAWYRDPDLFLEDLSGLKLDERAERALRESIRAFNRELYLAAASLLGVVSEAAWYAAADRLAMPGGKLEEEVRNERTAKVQTLVAGILRDRKAGSPTLPDELLANASLLRELRNYGVHPVKVRDDLERYFHEEECGLLLLRTHNYLVRLLAAVDAAASQP